MAPLSPVILIVEDELLLRMDSAEMIEKAGFEVVRAGNADEAIAILQARPAIHVVRAPSSRASSCDDSLRSPQVRRLLEGSLRPPTVDRTLEVSRA
ncbi:MAG: hypothetical protein QOJ15_11426 [Bradyrhizobium sp.]|jgi:CheY-like chemotaxis protein|nr:hypothetical protein [Bradyrhizobium sp.]